MQKYLFLLVTVVVVFYVASELRIERERVPTEGEVANKLLEDFIVIRPRDVDVLFKEFTVDNKRREKILVMILKSDQEYMPRASRVPEKSSAVIKMMHESLPDYDFGTPKSEEANFYRLLTSNSEWMVSTIETSKGYYSRWKRITDMFSATSNE